jgi:XRE family transcriptional regulator, aerobic/anaerobic benzoate catabolism transcriptional regulator
MKTMVAVRASRQKNLHQTLDRVPVLEFERAPLLIALGERVRLMRARKGMTRRGLAASSAVSERHLANMELGVGNASIVLLAQVAQALDCPLADLISDEASASPERTLMSALLQGKSEEELNRARRVLSELFGEGRSQAARARRIALIGLRGAGKSSQGRHLAEALGVPFVELTRDVERMAGCSLAEIQNLLGQAAYRRYERRALEEVLHTHTDVVIATPGGIVSDPATYKLLLSECLTVWLRASPSEHMQRVVKQGDLRPMAGNREAMEDLQRILASRSPMYAKAELTLDTTDRSQAENFTNLLALVQNAREGWMSG